MKKTILTLVLLGLVAFGGLETKLEELACELGYTDSCASVGASYIKKAEQPDNLSPEIDSAKAIEFLDKACAHQHKKGCLWLGMVYQDGGDVKQDMAKATQLYKEGCDGEGGEWLACGLYADYQAELGEISEAALYYKRGCELGNTTRLVTTDEESGDIIRYLCEASESLKLLRLK